MALMSCGPAFMALVAESFADAGAAHGLDPDDAMRMVVETMGGTADYLARHGYDGPALRTRVATLAEPPRRPDQPRGERPAATSAARPWTRWWRPRDDHLAPRSPARTSRTTSTRWPRLPRADLHPNPHQLDPADAVQPLPRGVPEVRQRRDRPVPEPVPPLPAAGSHGSRRTRPEPDRRDVRADHRQQHRRGPDRPG